MSSPASKPLRTSRDALLCRFVVILALLPFGLVSCTGEGPAAPTATPARPTATATPQPPTPTPTPVPPTPTATAVPIQPANGYLFVREGEVGLSRLTIDNGTDRDALIKLVEVESGAAIRVVYIWSHTEWTIDEIPPGDYILRFALGRDWDPVLNRFQRDLSFLEFEDRLDFVFVNNEFSTWTATLHSVPGGTASTNTIDPDAFWGEY